MAGRRNKTIILIGGHSFTLDLIVQLRWRQSEKMVVGTTINSLLLVDDIGALDGDHLEVARFLHPGKLLARTSPREAEVPRGAPGEDEQDPHAGSCQNYKRQIGYKQ